MEMIFPAVCLEILRLWPCPTFHLLLRLLPSNKIGDQLSSLSVALCTSGWKLKKLEETEENFQVVITRTSLRHLASRCFFWFQKASSLHPTWWSLGKGITELSSAIWLTMAGLSYNGRKDERVLSTQNARLWNCWLPFSSKSYNLKFKLQLPTSKTRSKFSIVFNAVLHKLRKIPTAQRCMSWFLTCHVNRKKANTCKYQ